MGPQERELPGDISRAYMAFWPSLRHRALDSIHCSLLVTGDRCPLRFQGEETRLLLLLGRLTRSRGSQRCGKDHDAAATWKIPSATRQCYHHLLPSPRTVTCMQNTLRHHIKPQIDAYKATSKEHILNSPEALWRCPLERGLFLKHLISMLLLHNSIQ